MLRGSSLKLRIIHLGTVVRLVGDCADDDKRDSVQKCTVCDGSALHLCAVALIFPDQLFFNLIAGDELVAAYHAPDNGMHIGVYLLAGSLRQCDELLICNELSEPLSGELHRAYNRK